MTKLNYTKNRTWAVEQTMRKHRKPKVGDIVLAFDYQFNCDSMTIGELVEIVNDDNPLGKFKVRTLEWLESSAFRWQQAYKIPEGLVSVETND